MDRRNILKMFPASLVGVVVVPGSAVAKTQAMTAHERMEYHLAEFKRAAQEADPSISEWMGPGFVADQGNTCAFVLSAFRTRFKFDGNGDYVVNGGVGGEGYMQIREAGQPGPRGEAQYLVRCGHSDLGDDDRSDWTLKRADDLAHLTIRRAA